MTAQGDAHVIDLHGDGIPPQQTFVQQLDAGTLDETQLKQAPLQFKPMRVGRVVTDLNDDAAVAAPGLAELEGIWHGARTYGVNERRS